MSEPPLNGNEAETLLGGIDRQRSIIAWKCGGLDASGIRATTAACPGKKRSIVGTTSLRRALRRYRESAFDSSST